VIGFAFNLDHSIMGFDNTFYYGQSQTGADNVSGFFIFNAIESVENSPQLLLSNPQTGIADTDAQMMLFQTGGYSCIKECFTAS